MEVNGAGGAFGLVDQAKHPSWWDAGVAPPLVGDALRVCVLDASCEPFPRLSALRTDIDIARRLRATPRPGPPGGVRFRTVPVAGGWSGRG